MRTIAFRLMMAFMCVIVFLVLQGGFAYHGFKELDSVYQKTFSHENEMAILRATLAETRLEMYRLIGTLDPGEMDHHRRIIEKNLQALDAVMTNHGIEKSLIEANADFYQEIMSLHYDFYVKTARQILETKSKEKHEQLFLQIERHNQRMAAKNQEEIRATLKKTLLVTLGLLISALLVAGIWAFIFVNTLTDRRRAENELKKSEQRLRAIFETAEAVSFIITDAKDPAPSVVEFSPGAERIFGYQRDEILGRTVSALHLKEDVAKFPETHQLMREGKTGFKGETILVRKSGEQFPALFSTYPLFDPDGHMYAALGVSIDISERRKLESQLQQSRKMEAIGTLAGGVAHDFNNLLSIIMGYSELVLDVLSANDPNRPHMEEIFKAGQRARDVVKQLLSFSRKAQINKQVIRIDKIIEENSNFLRSSIPATIDIQYRIDENVLPVYADKTQVYQVIINLTANAAVAMEAAGGQLLIELKNVRIDSSDEGSVEDLKAGTYVRLLIRDTGIGMSALVLERIFEPYFTTKGVGKGSGMGLAVVHGIVEFHDGHIQVESEPGRGTQFCILWPASEEKNFTRS